MFSVLAPGAVIRPHKGIFKGCLRYHLGLVTPNSDACCIEVAGEKYSWRDGEGVLFDDTFVHHVRNDTSSVRIVLFCDILRPLNFVGRLVNAVCLRALGPMTHR